MRAKNTFLLMGMTQFVCLLAFSLPAGKNLAVLNQQTKSVQYSRYLGATGHLRLVSENPLVENRNKEGVLHVSLKPFKRSSCTATFFKKPAYFVTAASCFSNAEGKVDAYRRFGKVFVLGKGWTIDQVSIVLHPKYKVGKPENDTAVFSLVSGEVEEFSKKHEPIELVSDSQLLSSDQSFETVAFGVSSHEKNDFGVPWLRTVYFHWDSKAVQKDSGMISMKPDSNGTGLLCAGDTGAGVFVALNRVSSPDSEVFLQSLLVLNQSEGYDDSAPCEKLTGHIVGHDFREPAFQQWIAEALKQSEGQIKTAGESAKELTAIRKQFYGEKNEYDNYWVNIFPAELDQLREANQGQHLHVLNQQLFSLMQRQVMILRASAYLGSTVNDEIKQPTESYILSEKDLWAPGSDWEALVRSTKKENVFIPKKGILKDVGVLVFRNIGEKPITVKRVSIKRNPNESLITGSFSFADKPFTFKPGRPFIIFKEVSGSVGGEVAEVILDDVSEKTDLLVHAIPTRRFKLRGSTGDITVDTITGPIDGPALVVVENPTKYSSRDKRFFFWHVNGFWNSGTKPISLFEAFAVNRDGRIHPLYSTGETKDWLPGTSLRDLWFGKDIQHSSFEIDEFVFKIHEGHTESLKIQVQFSKEWVD